MKGLHNIQSMLFTLATLVVSTCFAQSAPNSGNSGDRGDSAPQIAANNDSENATEVPEDEVFAPVFHHVRAGETVETIIRQYGLTREQFNKWNFLPNGLKPGVDVAVKFTWQNKNAFNKRAQPTVAEQNHQPNKYHQVEPGETLYHISVMYGVTVDELKQWNELSNNTIKVRQKLVVSN